ncbi:MAG: mechanosensitive ion channel [Gammaproteobacteria bacterium]|nr:mechanosensitive ion channel [Gammaproteobacteria bacterium]
MEDSSGFVSNYLIPWAINIGLAVFIFVVGRIVVKVVCGVIRRLLVKSDIDDVLTNFLVAIANALLLLVVIIAALRQLGVDTTSLIALIGAAGLAVGLALQNSLANFAAGVMLILFRPFKTGDFIEAGGTSGVAEAISIFSTTLRTGDNREVIVPNGAIYGGTITNFSARDTRRVDMVFGIGYDDDLLKAKQLIIDTLAADERVLKDPEPLVAVGELADSSVNFNVRPWVKSADYWGVMFDTTETLKLAFDHAGISIPYPQMDVHMDKSDG